jgi:ubiquinol-cytochrome c reductase cytochrome b subunit
MLAHPDNSLEASMVYTPLHIVPEWYYLGYYGMLKAIPGRSSGFLVMISYTLGTGIYGEPYGTGSMVGANTGYTGRYSLVSLLASLWVYSLWVGVQLPHAGYLSHGRYHTVQCMGCSTGYTGIYQHIPVVALYGSNYHLPCNSPQEYTL